MRFFTRRLGHLLGVLLAVTFLTYVLIDLLPGDPVDSICPICTEQQASVIRDDLNLDQPLPVRYVKWVGGVATGDFGRSYVTKREVSTILAERLPVSIELMLYAQLLALGLAVPLAIVSAWRANRPVDKAMTTATFGVISIPNFVLAVLLIYFLAVQNDWFTVFYRPDDSRLYSLFLPALALAAPIGATYMRLLRTDLITTLQEDFILMAKAKGMPTWRILLRHALRPSTFSLITVAGINTGALLGGTIIIENIFSIPGIGGAVGEAIFRDDFPVTQAVVLIVAVAYVIVNFLVDVLYTYLDPRVRGARALA